MSQFIIEGGNPLSGTIKAGGMKNAATPIIAATLLTKEECILENIPRIRDVERMLEILKSLGSKIEWIGANELIISNKDVDLSDLDRKTVQSMRSSILLLGPLLARFGSVKIPEPGGCIIGSRPIDTHLYILEKLGAKIKRENGLYNFSGKLKGTVIILPEFSVTATENAIMAACLAEGTTKIKIAAVEPHVEDLVNFLNSFGAKIKFIGNHVIQIEGVKKLSGGKYKIIPDQIEVGTFAIAGAVTKGEIAIENVIPEHLDIILLKLKNAGVNLELGDNYLKIKSSPNLKSFQLQTLPYPGFPTDLQAPFGVLATQCQGATLIHDPMYEGRMSYINELIKMGANAVIADPHRVVINGPTPLFGQEIKSLDLRAGATMIIAGLIAQGQTVINEAEVIDRGYERIEERLSIIGAKIKRVGQ